MVKGEIQINVPNLINIPNSKFYNSKLKTVFIKNNITFNSINFFFNFPDVVKKKKKLKKNLNMYFMQPLLMMQRRFSFYFMKMFSVSTFYY